MEADGQRIFLHRRDFRERRKRPEVGDTIRFTAGAGPTGRPCAVGAVYLHDGGRFGPLAFLLLLGLLVFPLLAVAKLRVDPRIAGGYVLAVSLLTYCIYAQDKARAREQAWRVPEAWLHLLELAGGWPGAFIAQRRLRHKCTKRSYQAVFWLIVALHQYVAFGFLQGWELPKAILRMIRDVIREVISQA